MISKEEPISRATIQGLYRTDTPKSFVTSPFKVLEFGENGVVGEARTNRQKKVGVRDPAIPPNREVIGYRDLSLIDTRSTRLLAEALGITDITDFGKEYGKNNPDEVIARLLGSNALLDFGDNQPDLNELDGSVQFGPLGSQGILSEDPDDAIILVTYYNRPCVRPWTEMRKALRDLIGENTRGPYMEAARNNRGYVGVTRATGKLAVGQTVHFFNMPRPDDRMKPRNVL